MNVYDKLAPLIQGLESDVPLNQFTSWKVGGNADLFIKADTEELLIESVKAARKLGVPYFILAGGNNVLISDDGVEGLVILNRVRGFEFDGSIANAHTGENLAFVILSGKSRRLGGLEEMVGIPGTVGGAVFGNAGSFGKETKDVLIEAEALDQDTAKTYQVKEIDYGFRNSYFKEHPELVILSAKIRFVQKNIEDIEAKIGEFQAKRHAKQPLGRLSCGSVFINPLPRFSGQIVEELGYKGVRMGNAVVSEKHANFIINEGGASAKDIKALIERIRHDAKSKLNVDLVPEVRMLGRW